MQRRTLPSLLRQVALTAEKSRARRLKSKRAYQNKALKSLFTRKKVHKHACIPVRKLACKLAFLIRVRSRSSSGCSLKPSPQVTYATLQRGVGQKIRLKKASFAERSLKLEVWTSAPTPYTAARVRMKRLKTCPVLNLSTGIKVTPQSLQFTYMKYFWLHA